MRLLLLTLLLLVLVASGDCDMKKAVEKVKGFGKKAVKGLKEFGKELKNAAKTQNPDTMTAL
ncbi:hypothetical protein GCK32_006895 [Trichostrongylus colubriformis]|uniref:Uncharacterized protein n=1 Tax=Trichostrongylus colubriformis TaxID=6319 RepID=A0AAN8IVR2_TRICO